MDSSSDSDTSERNHNVNSLSMRSSSDRYEGDESYSFKRKLGDLVFDANFEGGNLGHVEQVDRYTYEMIVRPDVSNPRHRLWFNFTVCNQLPNQCVIFNFINLSEYIKLFHEGLTPVVRSRHHPNWTRLHPDQAFYYRSSNHSFRYILSVAFRFSSHDDKHQFALFYPYNYTTTMSFINRCNIKAKRLSRSQDTESGKNSKTFDGSDRCVKASRASHRVKCHKLRTTSPNTSSRVDYTEPLSISLTNLTSTVLSKSVIMTKIGSTFGRKPKVIISCRRAGNLDSAASFVCQGMIDYLVSDCNLAHETRKNLDFIAFPMVDPDSVWCGNYCTNIFGQNVGVSFPRPHAKLHENYHCVRNIIEKTCNESDRVILLDLKVNINLIGSRILGTCHEDPIRMERHLAFPRSLERFAPDFYLENCRFVEPELSSSTIIDSKIWPHVDEYQLEMSPFAFYKKSSDEKTFRVYEPRDYLALGKATVCSLFELISQKPQQKSGQLNQSFVKYHRDVKDLDYLSLHKREQLNHGI